MRIGRGCELWWPIWDHKTSLVHRAAATAGLVVAASLMGLLKGLIPINIRYTQRCHSTQAVPTRLWSRELKEESGMAPGSAIQLLAEGRSEWLSSPARGFTLQRAQAPMFTADPEMR